MVVGAVGAVDAADANVGLCAIEPAAWFEGAVPKIRNCSETIGRSEGLSYLYAFLKNSTQFGTDPRSSRVWMRS